ncbi:DELLA protein [Marchantia polymorpha subsp. ruderalis]|uniref:DELLA protein n=2 Tax=Marchantia polymorpha TaxID=3197 RepID=A0AAF6BYU8_MARPO|nr:hypothetical protein MARPO_0003s0271 [Marchantia polymorpha]BBN17182.1 hypothetical protein Mp_7g12630 [Marchantia polymorpha subsp. ruderalis]|eukprot:PTQ49417.1 hypothetical protein MARPO_0003s0271 [Marchantia polymorpha]
MNYGGAPDFQLASFLDGLDAMMISMDQGGGNQQSSSPSPYANAGVSYGQSPSPVSQSSFVDVSSVQSPPDSVYNDTLDSEIAQSDMSALTQNFVVNEPWFDDSGNLVSFPISSDAPSKNSAIGRSPAPAGLDQSYTQDLFEQQFCHEEEDMRPQFPSHSFGSAYGFNNTPFSLLKGTDTASSVGSCGNGSSGSSLSRGRSVGSVSSPRSFGVAPQRMLLPPLRSNSSTRIQAYPNSIFQQEPGVMKWSAQPAQASAPQQQQQQQQQQRQQQQQQQQQQALRRPALPVEPEQEDSGLRLVHLLMACAKAIQAGDRHSAEATVRKIKQAVSMAPQQSAGPMIKVAAHFAEALTRRIYGVSPNFQEAMLSSASMKADFENFYDLSPYLRFAHFSTNQAILEAFTGANHVHVIDFHLNYGLQWPCLMQALAMRPGGPPTLKLTGIGPPELGGEDSLQDIGRSLATMAGELNVNFKFRGVVAERLDDIQPWMLQVQPGEVVAVNSIFQLHKLLHAEGSNEAGLDEVLRAVKSLNPKVVTIAEQEANHNIHNFLDRFVEALHFYSSMFDSLEASKRPTDSSDPRTAHQRQEMYKGAERYLGREICNIVACEGAKRVERHENLEMWKLRLRNAGYQQLRMPSTAYNTASLLLNLYSGQGYRVEDNCGCITLCWDGKPLLTASAWQ